MELSVEAVVVLRGGGRGTHATHESRWGQALEKSKLSEFEQVVAVRTAEAGQFGSDEVTVAELPGRLNSI